MRTAARAPVLLALAGAAAVAVVLSAAHLTRAGAGTAAPPAGDSLVRIDPRTNRVAATIAVGAGAGRVAVGGGYVWVASAGEEAVLRVDPGTKRVFRIPVFGAPTDLAFAGGTAVVVVTHVDGRRRRVVRIDAATGKTSKVAAPVGGNGPLRLAAGREGLWLADPARQRVTELGEPTKAVPIVRDASSLLAAYRSFDGLAVGQGSVWVAGDAFARTIWRIDPRERQVVEPIWIPFVPGGIAAGAGAVWVTSLLDDTVSRVNPATGEITTTVHVGRGSYALAAAPGAVWVASSIDDTVSRIDPLTNRIVATVPLPFMPVDVAVGAGGVWVVERRS